MAASTQPSHTLGPATYRKLPRFYTKPSTIYYDWVDRRGRRRVRRDTGGGYERWRSWEHDPTKPGDGKTDVYVSVHRLCAVAWWADDDATAEEILPRLRGVDVHHTTGIGWANFGESPNFDEPGLELLEHGRHAEITNEQRRAWAEDAKEDGEAPPEPERCAACGTADGGLWRSEDFDGARCLDCAADANEEASIVEA